MHPVQQKLFRLADNYDLGGMTFREIAKMIGEEHPQTVKHHLEQLEKRSLIEWNKEKKIIKKTANGVLTNSDFIIVPVLGAANCGPANMYADEQIQGHIKISIRLLRNRRNVFAVKAVGPSMNKANINGKGIEDGDFVIIDPSDKDIQTNDYVLSVIDEVANIKKVVIDRNHQQISLLSESTRDYPPIYISTIEAAKFIVNGKVIQVIKA